MKIIHYIKDYGIKAGPKRFIKEWFAENKVLFWIVTVIILSGILPIFPQSTTITEKLDIHYFKDERALDRHEIAINNYCSLFYVWDDIKSFPITNYNLAPWDSQSTLPKTVSYNISDYTISIFAIKGCDSCINMSSLSIGEERTCPMEHYSIFGFFEKCEFKQYETFQKMNLCEKNPFVISDNIQLISPDRKFKIAVKPYLTRIITQGDRTTHSIDRYHLELIITYPEWKPLPYAKWIGTFLLFILDPLKSVLRYFIEKWNY